MLCLWILPAKKAWFSSRRAGTAFLASALLVLMLLAVHIGLAAAMVNDDPFAFSRSVPTMLIVRGLLLVGYLGAALLWAGMLVHCLNISGRESMWLLAFLIVPLGPAIYYCFQYRSWFKQVNTTQA
jgi:uncharacterized membrane protein YhaH (DUF805 family)